MPNSGPDSGPGGRPGKPTKDNSQHPIDRLTKTRSKRPGASGPVDLPEAGARPES